MVKVTIYKDPDGRYEGFDCTGHARYADVGQDIVCAGVSALVINTINSVENLTENAAEAESDEETGEIRFRFKGQADANGKTSHGFPGLRLRGNTGKLREQLSRSQDQGGVGHVKYEPSVFCS